jgi:hypothetical protein
MRAIFSTVFLALGSLVFFTNAIAGPTVGQTTATLDDGSSVIVNYADYAPTNSALNSILVSGVIQNLVLAADRSTQTGCPYYAPKKGLIRSGDRIFITNNYIAWFDYTLNDGIGSTDWARSGGLAGYWSLDSNKADYSTVNFRHFYDPGKTVSGNTPNANGLCWNWARNELIPGSDSPTGAVYWWDTYSPPVEHTIVFKSTAAGATELLSTDYPQGVSGSQFTVGNTGWWDGTAGTHYTTSALLSGAGGQYEFISVNPNTTSGEVQYVLDYDCQQDGILVNWVFSSSVTVVPKNIYVDVWAAYAGLGAAIAAQGLPANETCGEDSAEPVAAMEYGVGASPYHSFEYVQSSLPTSTLSIENGTAATVNGAADAIVAFPWTQTDPCNKLNGGKGYNAQVATTPITTGVPQSAMIVGGFSSSMSSTSPLLRVTNMVNPQQTTCTGSPAAGESPAAGNCPESAPAAFPLQQFIVGYEHSDQTQGILFASQQTGQTLIGGQWYIVGFMLSSQ